MVKKVWLDEASNFTEGKIALSGRRQYVLQECSSRGWIVTGFRTAEVREDGIMTRPLAAGTLDECIEWIRDQDALQQMHQEAAKAEREKAEVGQLREAVLAARERHTVLQGQLDDVERDIKLLEEQEASA